MKWREVVLIVMHGQGWKKALGTTLVALAGIGTAGNLDTKPVEGIIGGAVLGAIGGVLIHADKKKGKGMAGSGTLIDKHLLKHVKHVARTKARAKQLFDAHAHKPVHVRDVLGPNWKMLGRELISKIPQRGTGLKSALKDVKDFFSGKKKLKPSHILDALAGVVGIAGAASSLIPGVDLISVPAAGAASLGLKSAAHLARTSGRGISDLIDTSELGLEGMSDPARITDAVEALAQAAGSELSKTRLGVLLGVSGAALAGAYKLYKKFRSHHKRRMGKGLKLAGQGLAPSGGALPRGVTRLPSGKIKKDRYSVFHGFYPATGSGLRKEDFFLDGYKVKSKRLSQLARERMNL